MAPYIWGCSVVFFSSFFDSCFKPERSKRAASSLEKFANTLASPEVYAFWNSPNSIPVVLFASCLWNVMRFLGTWLELFVTLGPWKLENCWLCEAWCPPKPNPKLYEVCGWLLNPVLRLNYPSIGVEFSAELFRFRLLKPLVRSTMPFEL